MVIYILKTGEITSQTTGHTTGKIVYFEYFQTTHGHTTGEIVFFQVSSVLMHNKAYKKSQWNGTRGTEQRRKEGGI